MVKDGQVERMIPTADPDDGVNFNNLLTSTLTTKLADDHIWLSVFYRPTKTNFSFVSDIMNNRFTMKNEFEIACFIV